MNKARLVAASLVLASMTFAGVAFSQHSNAPRPNMPDTKPPPMRFPMSADNFRKLANWYIDLAQKNSSRMSDESRSNMGLAILRMRDCTSGVTADGVVTSREASHCLSIMDSLNIQPAPRGH